jgi:hypothetical protein
MATGAESIIKALLSFLYAQLRVKLKEPVQTRVQSATTNLLCINLAAFVLPDLYSGLFSSPMAGGQ